MASTSTATQERGETHQSRGVIEDFVDLKLGDHAFQCILKCTDNLRQKLSRPQVDVDAVVEQGVLLKLISLLNHHDKRDDAILQRTAVQTLTIIVERSSHPKHAVDIVDKGAIPLLLNLLNLQQTELSLQALYLMRKLVDDTEEDVPIHETGNEEAFLKAMECGNETVAYLCLEFLYDMFVETVLPWKKTRRFISGMCSLLCSQNAETVRLTCVVLETIAKSSSDEDVLAMSRTNILFIFSDILKTAANDPTGITCVAALLSCVCTFVDRGPELAKKVQGIGLLDDLRPFLRLDDMSFPYLGAHKVLASVIKQGEQGLNKLLVRQNLVPSLDAIFTSGSPSQCQTVKELFQHLLIHRTYVGKLLHKHLGFFTYLQLKEKWDKLHSLLCAFRDALRETSTQAQHAWIRTAMQRLGHLGKLGRLQNCPSESVQSVCSEIIHLCS